MSNLTVIQLFLFRISRVNERKVVQPYTTFIQPLRQAKCVNLYQPRHTLESLRKRVSCVFIR